ncbi:hypothetical protein NC652_020135 [Populus alba x Populus x berolinensis]|nr:hypothetical protein NC652_020135 [Populus alba x Populus x berolinensis]
MEKERSEKLKLKQEKEKTENENQGSDKGCIVVNGMRRGDGKLKGARNPDGGYLHQRL